ncbi:MAG: bifunctional adenosylcobinamide kinase/adenosylcobinamide-phosphate guanylyltransferase [Pseudoflavonifractor sp.]
MTLIIGGRGQGKLDYVLEKLGLTQDAVAHDPERAEKLPVLAGLETWLRSHPEPDWQALLAENPRLVILCDEVGCGVVPVDPAERAWRERVGRTCCRLAARADRVERIFCGIATTLKGERDWN